MKKLVPVITLILVLCFCLTGCMGGQVIPADSDAVPYHEMPAAPPGLVPPEMPDYTRESLSDRVFVYTSGAKTLVCEYAVAPGGAASLREAVEGKNMEEFARQYAGGLDKDYEIGEIDFIGTPGLLLTGTLAEDSSYGRVGETAACSVAAYGDYFLLVSAYGSGDSASGEVEAFLAGFAVDNAPAGV